jgi:hypothetical protein
MERSVDTRLWATPQVGGGEDDVCQQARDDHGTEQLREQRFSLPSVQVCYHCANRCLDMWNDSGDHVARAWLLRVAEAWLQLASESDRTAFNVRPDAARDGAPLGG